jgi:hypothetical protein
MGGVGQPSRRSVTPPRATPCAALLCAGAWAPGTAENENSNVYRVSNVRFMTQGNSNSCSFVNRKDNGGLFGKLDNTQTGFHLGPDLWAAAGPDCDVCGCPHAGRVGPLGRDGRRRPFFPLLRPFPN